MKVSISDLIDSEVATYLKGGFLLLFGLVNVISDFFLKFGMVFEFAYLSALGGFIGLAYRKFKELEAKKQGKKVIEIDPFMSILFVFLGTTIGLVFTNMIHYFWLKDMVSSGAVAVLVGMFWELFYKRLFAYAKKDSFDNSKIQSLDDDGGSGSPNQIPGKPKGE